MCGCHYTKCQDGESTMRVDIEFDNYPEDISWNVTNNMEKILWNVDFENFKRESLNPSSFQTCVPKTGPLYFTIRDKRLNGLCCDSPSIFLVPSGNHGYSIYLDNELVGARKFPMGSKQELVLRAGSQSSQPIINQTTVWCEGRCQRCDVCPNDGDYYADESITFELYGVENCFYFASNTSNFLSNEFCSEIQDHVSASCGCPKFIPTCADNEVLFAFQTNVEDSPGTVTLQIRDQHNVTLRTKTGFIGNVGEIRDYKACIPAKDFIYVGLYDFCGEKELCQEASRTEFFQIMINNKIAKRRQFTKTEFEFAFFVPNFG
jgi:hypothetical protein